MTHGSLFSGIGGFDLATEWMGWTNVLNCEINEFCRKILKYHFPKAKHIPTYKQQTLPFGEDASTFSRADSLASRSASRENERARKTIVILGGLLKKKL